MKLSWLHSGSAVCLLVLLSGCNCGTKKDVPAMEQPAVEQVKPADMPVAPAPEVATPAVEQAPAEAPAPMNAEAGK